MFSCTDVIIVEIFLLLDFVVVIVVVDESGGGGGGSVVIVVGRGEVGHELVNVFQVVLSSLQEQEGFVVTIVVAVVVVVVVGCRCLWCNGGGRRG